jgi:hypothetical protein
LYSAPLNGGTLQIFVFSSETAGLSAFAGDSSGSKLPSQFAPWQLETTVEGGMALPHKFSRYKIESAIKLEGYQLWRLKKREAA